MFQLSRKFGVLTLALGASLTFVSATEAERLVLTDISIVDVETGKLRTGATVIIEEGRIRSVVKSRAAKLRLDDRVISCLGKYLIPGLWDMHIHLRESLEPALPVFVANGVTGVRDMGSEFHVVEAMRRKISSGKLVGPRIFTSGPILESRRSIERLASVLGEEGIAGRIGVSTPEEAEEAVRWLAEMPVDHIKFRTVANRAVYQAILDTAAAYGLSVVGHMPSSYRPLQVVESGQRSIEHVFFPTLDRMEKKERRDLFSAMADRGTYFVPTYVSGYGFRLMPDDEVFAIIDDTEGELDERRKYVPRDMVESWRGQMELKRTERNKQDWEGIMRSSMLAAREMREVGAGVLTGTDLGAPLVYPGFSIHDEMAALVEVSGMTPAESLRAATLSPTEFLDLDAEHGSVKVGKIANLVLLNGNPLESIVHTKGIFAVILNGRFYSRMELDALLESAASAFSAP